MTRKGPKPRPLDLESSVLTIFFTILSRGEPTAETLLFEGVLIYITWFTRKFSSTLSAVFPQAVAHFSVLKIMFYFLLFACFPLRLIAGLCAFFFSLGTNTDFLMNASVCVPCWLAIEKKDDLSLANFQTS